MQRLLRNVLDRISARASVWWSDIRFHWTIKNKAGLYFIAGAVGVVGLFAVFLGYYLDAKERSRNLYCLALNIYHESRGEPVEGQYAVAEVTMNRVASKHYPDSICAVVYQQNWDARRKRYVGMFSWTELDEKPKLKSRLWKQSLKVAEAVYNNDYTPRVEGALFYHATHIKPRWARQKKPLARIGSHIFY